MLKKLKKRNKGNSDTLPVKTKEASQELEEPIEVAKPILPAKSAAQQTVELLSGVDPDDVLQLMLPRLLKERQQRLAEIDRELATIDKRLGELQHRREDTLQVEAVTFEGHEGSTY